MKKTIYDLAKELGVAPSTVSKALSGGPGISDRMRKKIQDYANEVRYFPNANASKLKTKKSFTIGVIYSEDLNIGLEHNFFSSILQSFKAYVESHGYEITFVISNLGNRELSYLDFCMQKNIDGVFIVTSIPSDPYLHELIKSNISCVTTDIYYDNLFTIISDNVSGAKKAVKHFYDSGHRRIGHIAGSHYSLAARERMQGYKEMMDELGLEVKEEDVLTAEYYSFEHGYEAGEKFVKQKDHPSAVFVVADVIAMGFIKALKDHNVRVPEDVSVIGFDDLPFARHFEPSLSTMHQDTKKLGEKAALKLLELMNNKTSERTGIVKIPVELIVRDSVKNC